MLLTCCSFRKILHVKRSVNGRVGEYWTAVRIRLYCQDVHPFAVVVDADYKALLIDWHVDIEKKMNLEESLAAGCCPLIKNTVIELGATVSLRRDL